MIRVSNRYPSIELHHPSGGTLIEPDIQANTTELDGAIGTFSTAEAMNARQQQTYDTLQVLTAFDAWYAQLQQIVSQKQTEQGAQVLDSAFIEDFIHQKDALTGQYLDTLESETQKQAFNERITLEQHDAWYIRQLMQYQQQEAVRLQKSHYEASIARAQQNLIEKAVSNNTAAIDDMLPLELEIRQYAQLTGWSETEIHTQLETLCNHAALQAVDGLAENTQSNVYRSIYHYFKPHVSGNVRLQLQRKWLTIERREENRRIAVQLLCGNVVPAREKTYADMACRIADTINQAIAQGKTADSSNWRIEPEAQKEPSKTNKQNQADKQTHTPVKHKTLESLLSRFDGNILAAIMSVCIGVQQTEKLLRQSLRGVFQKQDETVFAGRMMQLIKQHYPKAMETIDTVLSILTESGIDWTIPVQTADFQAEKSSLQHSQCRAVQRVAITELRRLVKSISNDPKRQDDIVHEVLKLRALEKQQETIRNKDQLIHAIFQIQRNEYPLMQAGTSKNTAELVQSLWEAQQKLYVRYPTENSRKTARYRFTGVWADMMADSCYLSREIQHPKSYQSILQKIPDTSSMTLFLNALIGSLQQAPSSAASPSDEGEEAVQEKSNAVSESDVNSRNPFASGRKRLIDQIYMQSGLSNIYPETPAEYYLGFAKQYELLIGGSSAKIPQERLAKIAAGLLTLQEDQQSGIIPPDYAFRQYTDLNWLIYDQKTGLVIPFSDEKHRVHAHLRHCHAQIKINCASEPGCIQPSSFERLLTDHAVNWVYTGLLIRAGFSLPSHTKESFRHDGLYRLNHQYLDMQNQNQSPSKRSSYLFSQDQESLTDHHDKLEIPNNPDHSILDSGNPSINQQTQIDAV